MIDESAPPPKGNMHPDVMDLTKSTTSQVKPLGKEGGSKSRKELSPNDDYNEPQDGDVAPGKHLKSVGACWHDVVRSNLAKRKKFAYQDEAVEDNDAQTIREAVESGDGDVVLEYVEWMQGHLEQLTEENSLFAEAHESLVEDYNELAGQFNALRQASLEAQLKVHLQDFMFGCSLEQMTRAWKWMVSYEDMEKMATDIDHCAKRLHWIKESVVGGSGKRAPMDFAEQMEREGESFRVYHEERKAVPLPETSASQKEREAAWRIRHGIPSSRRWEV